MFKRTITGLALVCAIISAPLYANGDVLNTVFFVATLIAES
jgi:hypothetical protein